MGLRKEQSVWQSFNLNEGFLIESRFWVSNPLYEGSFLGPDKMGKL